MRKEFAKAIIDFALKDTAVVFITGDLGFMALEEVRDALKNRFINAGVAEQNIVSVSAGLAAKGFKPVLYSIAPFITLRPYEQIRNDVCFHNLDVKIVANGGGYGYGIMGATHHVLEDVCIMRALPNMKVYVPSFGQDVTSCVEKMLAVSGPSYLRLGKSVVLPKDACCGGKWDAFRRISKGSKVVIAAMGPVIENVINYLPSLPNDSVDLWSITEFPFGKIPKEFTESIKESKKLLVVEEHNKPGGLSEALSTELLKLKISGLEFMSLTANGYPSGLYGSQTWHQLENNLAGQGLADVITGMLNERN